MTTAKISGVRLAGIASAVPEKFITNDSLNDIYGVEEMEKISASTGIYKRHIAPAGMCASDLCVAASDRLIEDLQWQKDSIDAIIFISQSPDYIMPATACTIQQRLGLSKNCAAFDVNLGCSAYPYGLWLASSLIASGGVNRALLMVGDVGSGAEAPYAPRDRGTAVLFGDAGSVTALERDENAPPMTFQMGTDGGGKDHLIVRKGGWRNPYALGSKYEGVYLHMDGAEVFTFTLTQIPKLVKSVLALANWSIEETDAFVMHQANTFILKHLMTKLKIPDDKMIIAMEDFGNTSCASIPLSLTHALKDKLRTSKMNLVLTGFGIGLSWASVALTCGEMVMSDLVLVDESKIYQDTV
jgi:3-oxoacyl-[acyl-carrier-protein] synthase III